MPFTGPEVVPPSPNMPEACSIHEAVVLSGGSVRYVVHAGNETWVATDSRVHLWRPGAARLVDLAVVYEGRGPIVGLARADGRAYAADASGRVVRLDPAGAVEVVRWSHPPSALGDGPGAVVLSAGRHGVVGWVDPVAGSIVDIPIDGWPQRPVLHDGEVWVPAREGGVARLDPARRRAHPVEDSRISAVTDASAGPIVAWSRNSLVEIVEYELDGEIRSFSGGNGVRLVLTEPDGVWAFAGGRVYHHRPSTGQTDSASSPIGVPGTVSSRVAAGRWVIVGEDGAADHVALRDGAWRSTDRVSTDGDLSGLKVDAAGNLYAWSGRAVSRRGVDGQVVRRELPTAIRGVSVGVDSVWVLAEGGSARRIDEDLLDVEELPGSGNAWSILPVGPDEIWRADGGAATRFLRTDQGWQTSRINSAVSTPRLTRVVAYDHHRFALAGNAGVLHRLDPGDRSLRTGYRLRDQPRVLRQDASGRHLYAAIPSLGLDRIDLATGARTTWDLRGRTLDVAWDAERTAVAHGARGVSVWRGPPEGEPSWSCSVPGSVHHVALVEGALWATAGGDLLRLGPPGGAGR